MICRPPHPVAKCAVAVVSSTPAAEWRSVGARRGRRWVGGARPGPPDRHGWWVGVCLAVDREGEGRGVFHASGEAFWRAEHVLVASLRQPALPAPLPSPRGWYVYVAACIPLDAVRCCKGARGADAIVLVAGCPTGHPHPHPSHLCPTYSPLSPHSRWRSLRDHSSGLGRRRTRALVSASLFLSAVHREHPETGPPLLVAATSFLLDRCGPPSLPLPRSSAALGDYHPPRPSPSPLSGRRR